MDINTMDIKLLKRVRDRIAARPRQFVMRRLFDDRTESDHKPSHCGTACCILGWGIVLQDSEKRSPKEFAQLFELHELSYFSTRNVFGISWAEGDKLVWADNWPEPFRTQFSKAKTDAQHARIAVRRINHFIKTKGKE